MKKILFFFYLIAYNSFSQVSFPNNSLSAGTQMAERISSFTVLGANDRLEIVNGTQNDEIFIPTLWSYRSTNNTFGLVLTSSIASNLDTGTSPVMLFTTNIAPIFQPNAPTTGDFPWGNSGTTIPILNRPVFQWRNNSNKIMTILANNNVGIGTETPTALLHTTGTVRFENLTDATNPFKVLGTDSSGNVFEYNPTELAGSGTSDADWLKPDGTLPSSIDDTIYTNGLVGINTANPSANLHTVGTLKFENVADATNPFKVLGTDSSGNVFEYNPTELAGSGTSDADWLKPDGTLPSSIDDTIYTNGLVGINTANPSANLHTVGTLKFENVADATNPFKVLGTDSSGNVFEYNPEEFGNSSSDADWLKLDNSIPMSLNDAIYTLGKVGIGTNSIPNNVGNESVSQYGLFVTGGILTEEVRVAVVNEWADFVFENDYLLPALNEVEKYIKENKHLKGVPTAKEVKENGVELKEMNKILLQKIEELTLYIIELDKKVEQQQIEIEQLKTK